MQRPSRILLVDDNPVNLKVLTSLLADYVLRTATSGHEALEVARQFRPDVILLDIMLPGMDGYATCRKIRDNPNLRHTKTIMLSAKASLKERLAGYDAGADDYVTKPYDGDELLAKVRVYLKLKSVEEVEEVKNRTIEVLQHSNRTPLNNIISYAEILAWEPALAEEMRNEAAAVILRNARRLHRLLEKGETLAAMKSGQYCFVFADGDLAGVVRGVVEELEAQRDERQVDVDLRLPAAAKAVFDGDRIDSVVRILLDNAVRFSAAGGRIEVALEVRNETLALVVADHGDGIPDDVVDHVFEPFGDAESPLLNRGDGLSLAIAQEIVWAHDGEISVDTAPGKGATFSITLPVAGPDRSPGPAEQPFADLCTV